MLTAHAHATSQAFTASYWTSTALLMAPRNPVEHLIQRLLDNPEMAAVVGPVAGCEWWWQDTDHTDPPKVHIPIPSEPSPPTKAAVNRA